jgi:hypothetical protein
MSEGYEGFEHDKCHFCGKGNAGYQRRETYATVGPWFDACEKCARKPYEQPKQFQENEKETT